MNIFSEVDTAIDLQGGKHIPIEGLDSKYFTAEKLVKSRLVNVKLLKYGYK